MQKHEGERHVQKKILAVAVAGALTAPAVALAQSSVTVSGAINVWYETAGASGATNTVPATGGTVSTFDVKNRDRVQDGNGSNIRFTAVEDIGGGMQGFMQIESAVIANANQRNDAAGTPAAGTTFSPQAAGGWATRNSGVGLRGQAWGEILLGIWDVHYNEQDPADGQRLRGAAQATSLGLLNTFGNIGAINIGTRYSNVIRYQSPNWAGFNFKLAYVRPTDNAVPTTTSAASPNVQEGTKNKAINFAPQWSNGPIFVGFSYLKDSDIAVNQLAAFSGTTVTNTTTGATIGTAGGGATIGSAGATNLAEVKSNRLTGAYTFPFGLKLGLIYDMSKLSIKSTGTATAGFGSSEIKRNVWVLPISFNTGAHTIFATYAQADKLKGSVGGAGNTSIGTSEVGITPVGAAAGSTPLGLEENSKAKFYSLGYQFDLSKRTNIHFSFNQIKNDKLASYDFFSNAVNMNAGSFGADPRTISLGIRHAF
jgi:predicted porin